MVKEKRKKGNINELDIKEIISQLKSEDNLENKFIRFLENSSLFGGHYVMEDKISDSESISNKLGGFLEGEDKTLAIKWSIVYNSQIRRALFFISQFFVSSLYIDYSEFTSEEKEFLEYYLEKKLNLRKNLMTAIFFTLAFGSSYIWLEWDNTYKIWKSIYIFPPDFFRVEYIGNNKIVIVNDISKFKKLLVDRKNEILRKISKLVNSDNEGDRYMGKILDNLINGLPSSFVRYIEKLSIKEGEVILPTVNLENDEIETGLQFKIGQKGFPDGCMAVIGLFSNSIFPDGLSIVNGMPLQLSIYLYQLLKANRELMDMINNYIQIVSLTGEPPASKNDILLFAEQWKNALKNKFAPIVMNREVSVQNLSKRENLYDLPLAEIGEILLYSLGMPLSIWQNEQGIQFGLDYIVYNLEYLKEEVKNFIENIIFLPIAVHNEKFHKKPKFYDLEKEEEEKKRKSILKMFPNFGIEYKRINVKFFNRFILSATERIETLKELIQSYNLPLLEYLLETININTKTFFEKIRTGEAFKDNLIIQFMISLSDSLKEVAGLSTVIKELILNKVLDTLFNMVNVKGEKREKLRKKILEQIKSAGGEGGGKGGFGF